MKDYIRSFKKIVPSLRETTLETILKNPVYGEKIEIPINDHSVDVYWHKAENPHSPVLFELHGGGFALGHAMKDDLLCEKINKEMNIHVVGINYRKAPEHPYPAAIDDVTGVLEYFGKNADFYGMDQNKFALMGFSAGANLAAVASMQLKKSEVFQLVCQILHYPFLDAVTDPHSKEKHPADLPCEVMEAFNALYASEEDRVLPWISPIFATEHQLEKVPPAVILTAKEDALCTEGLLYGKMLKKAGVEVYVEAIENAHHGYIEDYYNNYCFDILPDETKASFCSNFGEAAENALELAMNKLSEYLDRK